jgi:hypothetical protein
MTSSGAYVPAQSKDSRRLLIDKSPMNPAYLRLQIGRRLARVGAAADDLRADENHELGA